MTYKRWGVASHHDFSLETDGVGFAPRVCAALQHLGLRVAGDDTV